MFHIPCIYKNPQPGRSRAANLNKAMVGRNDTAEGSRIGNNINSWLFTSLPWTWTNGLFPVKNNHHLQNHPMLVMTLTLQLEEDTVFPIHNFVTVQLHRQPLAIVASPLEDMLNLNQYPDQGCIPLVTKHNLFAKPSLAGKHAWEHSTGNFTSIWTEPFAYMQRSNLRRWRLQRTHQRLMQGNAGTRNKS